MPSPFATLAGRIVDALLEISPDTAYYAGDHRFDDRLPDLSDDAARAAAALLREASHALAEVDEDTLSEQDRVDHAMLARALDQRLFEYDDLREREWNPLRHNPGPLLYGLIARPFAPAAQRLESLAGRLAALPDHLATARAVLGDCPRVHLETAVGQFAGVAALIRTEVPAFCADVPAAGAHVAPVADTAAAAVDEFGHWLRARLADADRDPRLGRRLWEAKLWHSLDTELSAADLLARAYTALDRTAEEIRCAAGEMLDVANPDDETVRAALALVATERPSNATIVGLAEEVLSDARSVVAEHDLVTLLDDPLVVQEMPEFARGSAVAYCDSVGPLETASVPTFFAIAPTPGDWSSERVDSFFREYNNHMVRNLAVHEAMPGHYLQLAHARRFSGTSAARAVCESGTFIEGWAVYAEKLMADLGYGGIATRLQQLKSHLRMTINAILDQLVHCESMTEAEAMDLMTRRGFQEEGEAAGKWRRAQLSATQLSTYFVGYTEMAAIAAARPADTPVGRWHDAMLAHGCPSPRHLRTLLAL
jgi:hypothetical protein